MASTAVTHNTVVADRQVGAGVAIVDFGLGNLFSVMQACRHAGLRGFLTAIADEILGADAVILPGIGAFGDAMSSLHRLDLVSPLRDAAASGKPLFGVCLGLQLLMEESHEFGLHKGLGIVEGDVIAFDAPAENGRLPHPPFFVLIPGSNRRSRTPLATPGPVSRMRSVIHPGASTRA